MAHQAPRSLSLLLLALAAALPAQTQPRLIGLTRQSPFLLQLDRATCAPTLCNPPVPSGNTLPPYYGGSAYDATRGGLWVSDGTQLSLVHPTLCMTMCGPYAMPGITGLAVDESANTLYVVAAPSVLGIHKLGCPPVLQTSCLLSIPPGRVIGGCATSDVQGLVFYTSSNFGGGNPSNTLHVATRASPCVFVCSAPIPDCVPGIGPITGAAYDDCARLLWLTDGRTQMAFTYLVACGLAPVACCPHGIPDTYVGLCVLPSRATAKGPSCTSGTCPSCPLLEHHTIGDPTLGNPSFTLALSNAPANASAYLVLGFGPCAGPYNNSLFCTPLLVPPVGSQWLVAGTFATGGTGGCTGSVTQTFAISPFASSCGVTLCSQYLVLCTSGGIGVGMSNCLSWTISSS